MNTKIHGMAQHSVHFRKVHDHFRHTSHCQSIAMQTALSLTSAQNAMPHSSQVSVVSVPDRHHYGDGRRCQFFVI